MKRFHLNTLVALAALLPAAAWAQTYTAGPGLALAVPDDGYNGTQGSMGCSTIAVASGGGGGDTVATTTVQVAMSHTWIGRASRRWDGMLRGQLQPGNRFSIDL